MVRTAGDIYGPTIEEVTDKDGRAILNFECKKPMVGVWVYTNNVTEGSVAGVGLSVGNQPRQAQCRSIIGWYVEYDVQGNVSKKFRLSITQKK